MAEKKKILYTFRCPSVEMRKHLKKMLKVLSAKTGLTVWEVIYESLVHYDSKVE